MAGFVLACVLCLTIGFLAGIAATWLWIVWQSERWD